MLFAVLFVGGLGDPIFTYSIVISGISLIAAGAFAFSKGNVVCFAFSIIAGITYLPILYQRFTYSTGIEWDVVFFDVSVLTFIFILIISNKPNQSLKSETPKSGAN